MGDRLSGEGIPGRRHVHPGDSVSGPAWTADEAEIEARFAALIRPRGADPEAERRAVTAFAAARDAGAHHAARTRRRDDWRPREPWRARFSVKATLSVLLASVTLGGVAVAAIGTVGSSSDDGHDGGRHGKTSTLGPRRPGGAGPSGRTGRLTRPNHPDTAKDTLAHCRAYEQGKGRAKSLNATAWQRLVVAAGGEKNVGAYCAWQLERAAASGDGKGGRPGASGKDGKADNSGESKAGSGEKPHRRK